MPDSVFECGNLKCHYTIASDGLNQIQLKVLRRWAKTCPKCQQRTKWQEKLPLLNKQTNSNTEIGELKNVVEVSQEDRKNIHR